MKTIQSKSTCLAAKVAGSLFTMAVCLMTGNIAEAHLTYSGRNFGSFSGLINAQFAITNQTCTGNYGWADAADGILGDSHKGRAFRFHLDNAALVTLTVSANPTATTNSLGDLTPAFSIYSGLAAIAPYAAGWTNLPASADHDSSPGSIAWRTWWVRQNMDPNATTEPRRTGVGMRWATGRSRGTATCPGISPN